MVNPLLRFRSLSNKPQYGSTPPYCAFHGSSKASTTRSRRASVTQPRTSTSSMDVVGMDDRGNGKYTYRKSNPCCLHLLDRQMCPRRSACSRWKHRPAIRQHHYYPPSSSWNLITRKQETEQINKPSEAAQIRVSDMHDKRDKKTHLLATPFRQSHTSAAAQPSSPHPTKKSRNGSYHQPPSPSPQRITFIRSRGGLTTSNSWKKSKVLYNPKKHPFHISNSSCVLEFGRVRVLTTERHR